MLELRFLAALAIVERGHAILFPWRPTMPLYVGWPGLFAISRSAARQDPHDVHAGPSSPPRCRVAAGARRQPRRTAQPAKLAAKSPLAGPAARPGRPGRRGRRHLAGTER